MTAGKLQTKESVTLSQTYFVFKETTYEPPIDKDITMDDIRKLDTNDLLTGLKKQRLNAGMSFNGAIRDTDMLINFYDVVVEKYKRQPIKGEKRDGLPTLREAFDAVGWPYDTARQFRHRYNNARKLFNTARPSFPQLTSGDSVKTEDKRVGTVSKMDGNTAYVIFDEEPKEPIAVDVRDLTPVKPVVKIINPGDLFRFSDVGEFQYQGNENYNRTATPTIAEQKKLDEAAAKKIEDEYKDNITFALAAIKEGTYKAKDVSKCAEQFHVKVGELKKAIGDIRKKPMAALVPRVKKTKKSNGNSKIVSLNQWRTDKLKDGSFALMQLVQRGKQEPAWGSIKIDKNEAAIAALLAEKTKAATS